MVRLVLLWKRGSVEAYGAVEEAVRAETGTYVTLAPTGLVVREKVEAEEVGVVPVVTGEVIDAEIIE